MIEIDKEMMIDAYCEANGMGKPQSYDDYIDACNGLSWEVEGDYEGSRKYQINILDLIMFSINYAIEKSKDGN